MIAPEPPGQHENPAGTVPPRFTRSSSVTTVIGISAAKKIEKMNETGMKTSDL